jgi:hypothetical protein
MSAVRVTFELSNYWDVVLVQHGRLAPDAIRRMAVEGVVNPKVMHAILPKRIVEFLGLPLWGLQAIHGGEKRDMVKDAFIELLGRGSVFNAIVEPNRTDALLGAIVMEDLDLIVDCGKNELVPRDPTTITSEIE